MNDANAKQQITDRIKNVTNILVTVSTNPSVDELSAALGLTLLLNKLDKHATAVFSGNIPPAITFLDPTKTFENTVDSLRDFIIALDKEKADRLRYRVEDNMVRIFITPYRARISEQDLEFTHGDFNVELVLALGVESREVLDTAIAAHGRILHDATVATINAQNKKSNLGSIDWQDPNASSLCEMLVAMSESLKGNLLDEQIATAFLTGIVAATNRFSNNQTSPKSMTMAAQLMAAGANQQLIAAKLEETSAISSAEAKIEQDGSVELTEGNSEKVRDAPVENEKPLEDPIDEEASENKQDSLGEITISHGDQEAEPPEVSELPPMPEKTPYLTTATIEEHDVNNKQIAGEEALSAALEKLGTSAKVSDSELTLNDELEQAALSPAEEAASLAPTQEKLQNTAESWRNQPLAEPSMGGQLNASTKEAEDEKRREEQSSLNKVILDHGPPQPLKGKTLIPPTLHKEVSLPIVSPPGTLAEIESSLDGHDAGHDGGEKTYTIQQEINTALPQDTAPPEEVSTPPPAPNPHESPDKLPMQEFHQSIFPPEFPSVLPPPPPLPDFSQLPPLPPNGSNAPPPLDAHGLAIPSPSSPNQNSPAAPPTAPASNEPGQFRIPGQ